MARLFEKMAVIGIVGALSTGVLTGCSPGQKGVESNGKKTTLVIHLAGSLKEAKDDSAVKAEIEKSFKQATGIDVNLDLQLHTNEDFNTKVNLAISANEQIDGIENVINTNDGLKMFMTKSGFATELNDLLDKDGSTLKSKIPEEAMRSVTIDGKILAIPSVSPEAEFGILIRKDWLTAAGLALPTTLDEFENALKKFKERGGNVVPLVGYPWDVDRGILPGAYGVNPYSQRALDSQGKLVPAYLIPDYKKVLSKEYQWAKEGLWDKDNTTRPTTSMDNLFISGKCGVYIQWPEITHLIDISKKCKAANPDAQFAILGPLKGPNGDSGFAKQPMAFTGLVIPKMSKNAEIVIKYLNWMCSDVKNYELAAYGIKGIDWTDDGKDLRGYPKGKEQDYSLQPPYSGAYKLLENIGMSDRILSAYTEEERQWIQDVRGFKLIQDPSEGIIFPPLEDQVQYAVDAQYKEFTSNVINPAWAGLKDPNNVFDAAVNTYRSKCQEYLDFIDTYYKQNQK